MLANSSKLESRVYCTYFDSGYLSRGLSLISSLRKQGDNSEIVVLALDDGVVEYFARYPNTKVTVITMDSIEQYEPRLLELKNTRSRMEYYFTCTPLLIEYALVNFAKTANTAIYLDADLYFFNDPNLIFEEFAGGSIGIIEHKYSSKLEHKLAKYGKYNVGLVAFRNDLHGRELLSWYKESCIDWCSDKPENGLYADQGYLNFFPERPGCIVLESPGFNLAPWNDSNFTLEKNPEGKILVGGKQLVFFHFHGVKKFRNRYVTSENVYRSKLTGFLKANIYLPYLTQVDKHDEKIKTVLPKAIAQKRRGAGAIGIAFWVYKNLVALKIIATGNSIKLPRRLP